MSFVLGQLEASFEDQVGQQITYQCFVRFCIRMLYVLVCHICNKRLASFKISSFRKKMVWNWRLEIWVEVLLLFESFVNSFLSMFGFWRRSFNLCHTECFTESSHFLSGLGFLWSMFGLNFEFIAKDESFAFDNFKDYSKCKSVERDHQSHKVV